MDVERDEEPASEPRASGSGARRVGVGASFTRLFETQFGFSIPDLSANGARSPSQEQKGRTKAGARPSAATAAALRREESSGTLHPRQIAAAIGAIEDYVELVMRRRHEALVFYLSLSMALVWLSKQTLGHSWDRPPGRRPLFGGGARAK
jgi:hypothetical protein